MATGLEIIQKENAHFKTLIEKLKSIILMPKEQALRSIQVQFNPNKVTRMSRVLSSIQTKGYSSSLSSSVELFLLARFETS
jgi:hypothetical protein